MAKKFEASKLNADQLADAKRLQDLWSRQPAGSRLSQAEFAARYDIGTQGNLSQYLLGKRPLNLVTASKFAKGLGVDLSQISPSLAVEFADIQAAQKSPVTATKASRPAALSALQREDKALLEAYKSLPKDTRLAVRMLIETLAGSMNGDLHNFMGVIEDFNRRRDSKTIKEK